MKDKRFGRSKAGKWLKSTFGNKAFQRKRLIALKKACNASARLRIENKHPIGVVYGHLTVIGYKFCKPSWMTCCRCACGNEKHVRFPSKMVSGEISSCGCVQIRHRENFCYGILPSGEAFMNSRIYHYKKSAERRKIQFTLSDEEACALFLQPCFYCGAPPVDILENKYNGKVPVNGIDRRENAKGYTKENSVPCCTWCNYAKSDSSETDFIAWLDRASRHRNR